jgi:hypothetical protein
MVNDSFVNVRPPDCPDDILEGAIKETHLALKEMEVAKEGLKVYNIFKKHFIDC